MIRGWIPGFGRPNSQTRYGDMQVLIDAKNNICFIIDGGCGEGTTALINYLKRNGIKKVYLAISHAHYDHDYGILQIIRDNYFTVVKLYCYDPKTLESGLRNNKGSTEVKSDISYLNKIISEAKAKGTSVQYLKHGDKITLGDIKFYVYRNQPSRVENDDTEGWSYVNDGSLCFYFYEWGYWTSGDGPEKIYDFIKKVGAKVKFFKVPHHGNNCTASQANGLKSSGANYCWYNDLEPNGVGTTDFTAYGARRCKQAGITVFESVGDINFVVCNGKFIIYKSGKQYSYSVSYKGENTLKTTGLIDVVRGVFMNKYSSNNARMTRLLDAGYDPIVVQNRVNLMYNVAKQIIDGKLNFGKNEERIKNLDAKFGKGYGQLIQDEINSLLNAKSKKW